MTIQVDPSAKSVEIRWAPRILALAAFGILALTLYPFRFSSHAHFTGRTPLLLQTTFKGTGALDSFLNVLLFIPFGFGLAPFVARKVRSRIVTVLLTYLAGALTSYAVELLQFYIPERDSGWQDIVTNSAGALVGGLIFVLIGIFSLGPVRKWEFAMERFVSPRSVAITLAAYLIPWFLVSAHWEHKDDLSLWNTNSQLGVGATGGMWTVPFHGRVYAVEVWDNALSRRAASIITSASDNQAGAPEPLARYEFSSPPPFQDRLHSSPPLEWAPPGAPIRDTSQAWWDGGSWAVSSEPVAGIEQKIQASGRFSVYVSCEPSSSRVGARIVSIGPVDDESDLEIRQQFADLIVWFRSRFSFYPDDLRLTVKNAFAANRLRNILVMYDGEKLSLYLDGREIDSRYRLGPWTNLALHFTFPKTGQLEGYRYAFFAFLFFPTGCVVGLAWRMFRGLRRRALLLTLAVILPPVLLELVLLSSGHPPFSLNNVVRAIVASLGGWFWFNLEGPTLHLQHSPSSPSSTTSPLRLHNVE
jgi:hypothetical protein